MTIPMTDRSSSSCRRAPRVIRPILPFACALTALAASACMVGKLSSAESRPAGVEVEDRPEPLVPRRRPSAADEYKQRSLSYYAAGLMYEQQGNREEALRHYQKALRYDPSAVAVLRQVIEVAWSLERHQEAIRYALKAAEVAPSNADLLERLAAFLADEKDVRQAITLYEKAIELRKGQEKTVPYVHAQALVARLYARREDFKRAAAAFDVVMAALEKPDDYGLRGRAKSQLEGEKGITYVLIGETYLRADRTDAAAAAFERAFKLSGDEALRAYHRAQVAEKRKQYDEVLRNLDEYLAAESDDAGVDPYELLQRIFAAQGKSAELPAKLESLLKQDPKNIPLRYFVARRYREAGEHAKAKPLYEELVRKVPTIDAYTGLLEASAAVNDVGRQLEVLAEVAAKTGDLEAVKKFVAALAADRARLEALFSAARKQAANSQPEDGKPLALAAGLTAVEAKRWTDAGEFFELALLHDPKNAPQIYLAWGLGLLADDKYADAVQVFHRAVDENVTPDNPAFQTYLALALEFDGRTEEALKMARAASELGDGALRYASRIPWILYHAKRYQAAAEAYEELIAKFDKQHKDDGDRQLLREARLSLSNIYVLLGDVAKAEAPLEAILDEFPDDVGAKNDLGYLWADQGKNLELARDMIEKAVAADPKNRAYRDSLGWVYFRLRRFQDAVVELEIAVKGQPGDEPPDGVILDHLADAYQAAGRLEDARRAWTRAAAAFDKAEDSAKAQTVRKKLTK